MKTTTEESKKEYHSPKMDQINIDSEISLVLESNINDNPFRGPDESFLFHEQPGLYPKM